MSLPGPCTDCGGALGSDQRYCVNCGHRVETPLAPTYRPVRASDPMMARSAGGWPFPIPISMAGVFAAAALAFGIVISQAIDPNLSQLVAGNHFTDDVQTALNQPGSEGDAKKNKKGGDKSGNDNDSGNSGAFNTGGNGSGFFGSTGYSPSYGTSTPSTPKTPPNTGGVAPPGKPDKPKPKPTYLTGTVVHKNPVAGSYSISSGGGLSAIHATASAGLPAAGTKVKVPIRKLSNGTYAENGKRELQGTNGFVKFSGVVTDSKDSVVPATPDTYTVSARGASVLVHADNTTGNVPPVIGSLITTTAEVRAPGATPLPPVVPPPFLPCGPPATPLPNPAVVPEKELFQSAAPTVSATGLTSTVVETVVQANCTGPDRTLASSDDIREGKSDNELPLASGLSLTKLTPGQAYIFSVTINPGVALTQVTGSRSDYGINLADSTSTLQGNVARSAEKSDVRIARAAAKQIR